MSDTGQQGKVGGLPPGRPPLALRLHAGHIHIAASRILIDGSLISDKHDWTLSERIVRDIERIFDWKR